MRWIKRKLQTLSSLTVAGYIKSAQAALFSRGIDLTVQNPRLNNLLSRVSARLRKFGTLTAQAVKNTDLDCKPVVSLGMIKTAFVAELNKIAERDWIQQLSRIRNPEDVSKLEIPRDLLTCYVMNVVALIGGLRKSDISKTCLVKYTADQVYLRVVNWKISPPAVKMKKGVVESDLKNARCRTLVIDKLNSPDDPLSWILALWETNSRKFPNSFLFQSQGRGARKQAWSDITVELKLRRIPLEHAYTHRFRVAHASLARAAGFNDSRIMTQVDWKHPSMIDRYERYLPKKNNVRQYIVGLGFGSGFK